MQALQSTPWARFIAAPAPLAAPCVQALAAWRFCRGFYPERLGYFAAVYGPVEDWEMLIELMLAIDDRIARQRGE